MEVVQFRRDSSSSVVDDIESAAIPLRGSPAALAADRDGPPRPRSATPLVRVGQHRGLEEGKEGAKGKQSIEGRATKEKKRQNLFLQSTSSSLSRPGATFSLSSTQLAR